MTVDATIMLQTIAQELSFRILRPVQPSRIESASWVPSMKERVPYLVSNLDYHVFLSLADNHPTTASSHRYIVRFSPYESSCI